MFVAIAEFGRYNYTGISALATMSLNCYSGKSDVAAVL